MQYISMWIQLLIIVYHIIIMFLPKPSSITMNDPVETVWCTQSRREETGQHRKHVFIYFPCIWLYLHRLCGFTGFHPSVQVDENNEFAVNKKNLICLWYETDVKPLHGSKPSHSDPNNVTPQQKAKAGMLLQCTRGKTTLRKNETTCFKGMTWGTHYPCAV